MQAVVRVNRLRSFLLRPWEARTTVIAILSLAGIAAHLLLRFGLHTAAQTNQLPLYLTLALGGGPLVLELLVKLRNREFGSDLLAGISIVTSFLLGEYLAGAIVVLMLSGGNALESFAVANASSVLRALAKRMPAIAHLKKNGAISDIPLDDIQIGDILSVYPHDVCPVDGVVIDGHGMMDESFLTGEPFQMTKAPGSTVISGAINGDSALLIKATRVPEDSRYAKITRVMRASEQQRPHLRRLGDQLGAIYTPIALGVALGAWLLSGEPVRFLAVLVIATPCPLLIAIPVAIIGSISLAARRAIIVKNPVVLEQIDQCRTAMFDKTGTLTYGAPSLVEQIIAPPFNSDDVLQYAASLELYSKHPLARTIVKAANDRGIPLKEVSVVSELPGQGLRGLVAGQQVQIISRRHLLKDDFPGSDHLPEVSGGLECIVLLAGRYAALYRFRDAPRPEGLFFMRHLGPKHFFNRIMVVSGDRESEVRYLADQLGIAEIRSQRTPEEKLDIVRRETARSKTLYVGDGINDAPAMMAATVGMAMGQNSDVASEAADVVVMESSLKKVDEFMHISRHMRKIAIQSAVGGMLLSIAGMIFAATGSLTPVAGALAQEIIDLLAVLNALRAALPPKTISDV